MLNAPPYFFKLNHIQQLKLKLRATSNSSRRLTRGIDPNVDGLLLSDKYVMTPSHPPLLLRASTQIYPNPAGPQCRSTCRRYPQELIDNIIDHLHNDNISLLNCALVCRAWLSTSRLHLFAKIHLHIPLPFIDAPLASRKFSRLP